MDPSQMVTCSHELPAALFARYSAAALAAVEQLRPVKKCQNQLHCEPLRVKLETQTPSAGAAGAAARLPLFLAHARE
jgi:hypothetical protein